ncbi:ATP-binding protein [Paenibacillus sp. JTLBN-2024]
MDQLIFMSQMAQKQMRALIAQLRPVELEGKNLEDALEVWFPDYCRQNALKGMKEVELQGKLSEAIEHQLFLIIQEAMANIVKHAHARLVSMSLREEQRQVVLSISDDGQGFNEVPHKTGILRLVHDAGARREIGRKRWKSSAVKVPERRFAYIYLNLWKE